MAPENELAIPPAEAEDNYHSSADKDEPLLFTKYPQPPPDKDGISDWLDEYPDTDSTSRKIFRENVWPGLGLFAADFLLFSTMNLKPLWNEAYPECFGYYAQCSRSLVRSLTFTGIWGLIVGMVVIGTLTSFRGRRYGSLLTGSLMLFSAVCICVTSLIPDQEIIFTSMAFFLFIFGVGLGGEYPVAAASATEKAMVDMYEKQVQVDREVAEQRRTDRESGVTSTANAAGTAAAPSDSELVTASEPEMSVSEAEGPPEGSPDAPKDPSSPTSVGSGENYDEDEAFIIEQERGQRVLGVFTMQGVGIFLSAFLLMVLLLIFGQIGGDNENSSSDYNPLFLGMIWRLLVIFSTACLAFNLKSRYEFLEESEVWASDNRARKRRFLISVEEIATAFSYEQAKDGEEAKPKPEPIKRAASDASETSDNSDILEMKMKDHSGDRLSSSLSLAFRNYWHRLFGTSLCWLLWDVAFYGNKLFQANFLYALTGSSHSLFELALFSSIFSLVSLAGYVTATKIIDHPMVGRQKLQLWGFGVVGLLFTLSGFLYDRLNSPALMFFYLLFTFFGQCGPNATTFIVPSEVFPTEIRTMCHGFSAAFGKIGAVIAAILFRRLNTVDMFLACGYASFIGVILTFLFIPDAGPLDLYALDERWHMILDGKKDEYDGPANDPQFCSYFERKKMGLPW